MSTQALLLLGGAGLLLAVVSVLIDRLNFPQPRFRARTVVYDRRRGPRRDRTGAHIVEDSPEPARPRRRDRDGRSGRDDEAGGGDVHGPRSRRR